MESDTYTSFCSVIVPTSYARWETGPFTRLPGSMGKLLVAVSSTTEEVSLIVISQDWRDLRLFLRSIQRQSYVTAAYIHYSTKTLPESKLTQLFPRSEERRVGKECRSR